MAFLDEAEEEIAVAMGTGNLLGHRAERCVHIACKLETGRQDFDLQVLALVGAGDNGSRFRQPAVAPAGVVRTHWHRTAGFGFGCCQPQVGVVGQFCGPLPGSLGQVALGQSLDAPGDPFDQPGPVVYASAFTEYRRIAGLQVSGGHLLEDGHLVVDAHEEAPFWGISGVVNTSDTEPGFTREGKAIDSAFPEIWETLVCTGAPPGKSKKVPEIQRRGA